MEITSKPVSTDVGWYCDYYNNEVFASDQNIIDDFYQLKKEIFEYYKV